MTGRSARDRNVGFVFQHYALFRHMNVFENIAFGLRVRQRPEAEVATRVHELLHLVRLDGLGKPLSVAAVRRPAAARGPGPGPGGSAADVLLLDEPFGALDAKVRQELRQWLRRLHDEIHVTSVFVTHDQEEAFEVADRVVVMNQGRIEQIGTPQEVFEHPANPFVMDFLGNVNVFHGRVQNGRVLLGNLEVARADYTPRRGHGLPPFTCGLTSWTFWTIPMACPAFAPMCLHLNPAGSVTRVHLRAADFGLDLQVDLSHVRRAELRLRTGDTVYVSPRNVRVFVPEQADYSI